MKLKKNYLSWFEAWDRLMQGEHIAAVRLSEGGWCYLRHQAWAIGRQLIDSGIGSYRTCYLA